MSWEWARCVQKSNHFCRWKWWNGNERAHCARQRKIVKLRDRDKMRVQCTSAKSRTRNRPKSEHYNSAVAESDADAVKPICILPSQNREYIYIFLRSAVACHLWFYFVDVIATKKRAPNLISFLFLLVCAHRLFLSLFRSTSFSSFSACGFFGFIAL